MTEKDRYLWIWTIEALAASLEAVLQRNRLVPLFPAHRIEGLEDLGDWLQDFLKIEEVIAAERGGPHYPLDS